MISVRSKGDFDKTTLFLKKARRINPRYILEKYGQQGLAILEEATPKDTGQTARSWYYEISTEGDQHYLTFYNSNVQRGVRIAIILDVGHGTGNGGYVQGKNYIKPAIRPVFDQIAAAAWKEVTDA